MNEEPPAKRRRLGNPWWWMLAIFLGACGYGVWRESAYQAAVTEAKESGFTWECKDTFSLIRQNYDNVWRRETWGEHPRVLEMSAKEVLDLGRYREMLHQLRPTKLIVLRCQDETVDGLKGLTALQQLSLWNCAVLQNVDGLKDLNDLQTLSLRNCDSLQNLDGLKGLTNMQTFDLYGCTALQNVDGLKGLTALQTLDLSGCPALQNVDVIKGLASLQALNLYGCPALQSVDGLKGIKGLRTLNLHRCHNIPAAALRELRAALPNTDIIFPDGTKNPPE